MTSVSGPSNSDPYTYQRPSTSATRALIDTPPKSTTPTPIPSHSHDQQHRHHASNPDPSHADGIPSPHHLERHRTHNYEEAIASRVHVRANNNNTNTNDNKSQDSNHNNNDHTSSEGVHVVSGLAYRGDNAKESDSRPGLLGRQQSWKASDQKRAAMEKILGSEKAGGYSSSSPSSAGQQ